MNTYDPTIHGVCGWARPVVRPGDETVEAYRLGRGTCSCGLEVRVDFTGAWVHYVEGVGCSTDAVDADECAMIRERLVAGTDTPIPSCPLHGAHPDLCECGHPGYDGHDMRSVPAGCMTPGCGCGNGYCDLGEHGIVGFGDSVLVDEGGSIPKRRVCVECIALMTDEQRALTRDDAVTGDGHGCLDHAIREDGLDLCGLCGLVLERSGDALVVPA